jgi:hypothetical protein
VRSTFFDGPSRSSRAIQKTHYLLAKAFDLAGHREEARVEAARAAELDSGQPEYLALKEQLNEK